MSAVILWVGRCTLPFSFLIAILIAPRLMLREICAWPRIWAQLWDDPL